MNTNSSKKKGIEGLYRRDKIGNIAHINVMHQVLYSYCAVSNEEGEMHIIMHLVHHAMPCDPKLLFIHYIFPF